MKTYKKKLPFKLKIVKFNENKLKNLNKKIRPNLIHHFIYTLLLFRPFYHDKPIKKKNILERKNKMKFNYHSNKLKNLNHRTNININNKRINIYNKSI
jgi:hypothetical protein